MTNGWVYLEAKIMDQIKNIPKNQKLWGKIHLWPHKNLKNKNNSIWMNKSKEINILRILKNF